MTLFTRSQVYEDNQFENIYKIGRCNPSEYFMTFLFNIGMVWRCFIITVILIWPTSICFRITRKFWRNVFCYIWWFLIFTHMISISVNQIKLSVQLLVYYENQYKCIKSNLCVTDSMLHDIKQFRCSMASFIMLVITKLIILSFIPLLRLSSLDICWKWKKYFFCITCIVNICFICKQYILLN